MDNHVLFMSDLMIETGLCVVIKAVVLRDKREHFQQFHGKDLLTLKVIKVYRAK